MFIHRTTARNLGAYFHEEGEKMELRIPINRRRAAIVKEVIRIAGGRARHLAGEFSTMPLCMIDEIPLGESEALAHLALDAEGDYEATLNLLHRFEKAGWIRDIWRRDVLEEMRDRLSTNDFDPEGS